MLFNKIESILSDVSSALPENMEAFKKDIEQNLRSTLNASFSKMELVTREEFDIQAELLRRTRMQLDELNSKLEVFEKNAN